LANLEKDKVELLNALEEEAEVEILNELAAEKVVELLNESEDELQEAFLQTIIIKLGRRIAELKEEQKRELHFQQGAGEEQDKGAMRKGEIVKFVWLLIFTVGIIFTIVAMIVGWLRILYGVIILFVLFGCVKAMPKGG